MTSVDSNISMPVLDLLGSGESVWARLDPVSFGRALATAGLTLPLHPLGTSRAVARLAAGATQALGASTRRAVGDPAAGPCPPAPGDRRFADRAFAENAFFFALQQTHLLTERFVTDLLDAAQVSSLRAAKAGFAARFLLDALAPTNMLLGNPAALREAFDSGGLSLARGLRTFVDDLRHNGGWPRQVDASGFEVGINMAATPGKVVFRNELIEVIQYAPSTAEVHSIPTLFCPPWINKYYIMDLAPGKSLIEWAVDHGHTCFAISYRNPDASMRETGFEDYLTNGPLKAIEVIRAITGSPRVNLVSACLGGTLTAIAMAYLARIGDDSVNSATFLNAHTDFTRPGMLGVFVDEATVAGLERRMARAGYLESSDMSKTFDALRANDLIFAYVANNWLLGKRPPSFDLLAWNADGTRMPAKMHSTYLRSCYLENQFARGEFRVAGAPVDPAKIEADTYVLSAVDDHIVPWQSAYQTTQLVSGKPRFVLSTAGHIAGIVNPPGPKAKHWTNPSLPTDADAWLADAALNQGTWWLDWAQWAADRSGAMLAAPTTFGTREHPVLGDAPGEYVRTRST